jgi:hypothetical protein
VTLVLAGSDGANGDGLTGDTGYKDLKVILVLLDLTVQMDTDVLWSNWNTRK